MKRRNLFITACVLVLAIGCMAACGQLGVTPPKRLTAPVVVLSGSVASWSANEDAERFEISIDGNLSFVENTVTSRELIEGQTFKIRAIGNGLTLLTSDWSNSVTCGGNANPELIALSVPAVEVDGEGLAQWTEVENASGYAYKLDGGAVIPTAEQSVRLTDGQSISVKAVGDGETYSDSAFSTPVTYRAEAGGEGETVEVFLLDGELDSSEDKNAAKLTVGAQISGDPTARFTKLELYIGDSLVLTDDGFEGFNEYVGLRTKTEYKVRLYYSGEGYEDGVKEVSVTTPYYELPEVDAYGSENNVVVGKHAIMSFRVERFAELQNYDVIVRGFVQNDAYFAPFIVEMLDDPTLLDRLSAESDEYYAKPGSYVWEALHYREVYLAYLFAWEHYERAGYSDGRWREIAEAEPQYIYEITKESGDLFVANDDAFEYNYYAVLRDYFAHGEVRFEIILRFDLGDGAGEREFNAYSVIPYFREVADDNHGFKIEEDEGVKNGYVLTETDDDYKALYVCKIALYSGNEHVADVPFTSDEVTSVDHDGWLDEWIARLKCETPEATEMEITDRIAAIPAVSFTFTAGTDLAPAGEYSLVIFSRSLLKDYEMDGYETYSYRNIIIKSDLSAPENVTFNGKTVLWSAVTGAEWYSVLINGREVDSTADTYCYCGGLNNGDEVEIVAKGRFAYDSKPSKKVIFVLPKLNAPTLSASGRRVSWNAVEHASKYVYTVNGRQYETSATTVYVGESGTVRVKAVDESGNYLDSDWTAISVSVSSSDKEK